MSRVVKKKLEDIITFGKYKGKSIHQLLNIDSSYLLWAHNTIEWFKLEDGIYAEVVDNAYNEKMTYYVENFDWGIDPYDWCD